MRRRSCIWGPIVAGAIALAVATPAGAADPELVGSTSGSCAADAFDEYSFGPFSDPPAALRDRFSASAGGGLWNGVRIGPGDVIWTWVNSSGIRDGDYFCDNVPGSYQLDTFRVPAPPASFSGRNTYSYEPSYPVVQPTYRSALAVDISVSQGAISVCASQGGCRTVASAGTLLLPALNPIFSTRRSLDIRALDGPQAIWSVHVRALPVSVSDLRLDRTLAAPGTAIRADYVTDGDTAVTGTLINAVGAPVRTLASGLAVGLGGHSLTWDGFDAVGGRVPDGRYNLQVAGRDPAGNSSFQSAQLTIDGTGPVAQRLSPDRMPASNALAVQVTDQFAGIDEAQLVVGGQIVDNFPDPVSSPARLSYRPAGGWRPGSAFNWRVDAVDELDNSASTSGTFKTLETPLSRRQAVKDIKRVLASRGLERAAVRALRVRCRRTGRSSARCRYTFTKHGVRSFRIDGKGTVGRLHGKRSFNLKIKISQPTRRPVVFRMTHRNRKSFDGLF